MSARLMSVSQLADITRKDRKTISKRLVDLAAEAGAKGAKLYDSAEALPLIYASDSTDDISKALQQEELGIERAKREKLEIEVGRLRGEMLPIDLVAKTVEREYNFIRSNFRSIPSKLAKPLSMITDPAEIHAALTAAVDEVLIELTSDKTYAKQRDSLGVSEEETDIDPPDSAGSDSEA